MEFFFCYKSKCFFKLFYPENNIVDRSTRISDEGVIFMFESRDQINQK